MPKLNLLEILKNTIVEQPGLYSRQELEKAKEESITNPDPTNVEPIDVRKDFEDIYIDYSSGESEIKDVINFKKEDLIPLSEYPTMGKCTGWKRLMKENILNGEPDKSHLKKLKYHPSEYLQPYAAKSFDMMEDHYYAVTGKKFKVSDTYRTYESQWNIFDLEYCIKTGKSRKVNTNGSIPVAKPGTSNHGFGEAVDMDPEGKTWIEQNGLTYGWCHGEAPEEPWHFTYDIKYCK